MSDDPGGITPTLQQLLRHLLETDGVVGGVLCSLDGLPLAAALGGNLDEEGLAAAGARLGQMASGCLGSDGLELAVMDATRLMIVVQPVALGYLVVAAEPAGKIESAMAAARRVGSALDQAAQTLTTPEPAWR